MKLDAYEFLEGASSLNEMWVFGYGSLMWNPGFEYEDSRVGFIEGYTRKFWQGNTTHRGTPDKPGRVATLIEDKENKVWGRVFHLIGPRQILPCLDHLGLRECTLGGYDIKVLPFHASKAPDCETVPALTFVATPRNIWYLGASDAGKMAAEIVGCAGVCGSNVEYVLRIADFMRREVEGEEMETELQQLETEILCLLGAKKSAFPDDQWEGSELDICGEMLDNVFRAVKNERTVRGQVPFRNQSISSLEVCGKVVVEGVEKVMEVCYKVERGEKGSGEAGELLAENLPVEDRIPAGDSRVEMGEESAILSAGMRSSAEASFDEIGSILEKEGELMRENYFVLRKNSDG